MRKRNETGETKTLIGYFVDDLIIVGTKESVFDTMNNIKEHFKCTELNLTRMDTEIF